MIEYGFIDGESFAALQACGALCRDGYGKARQKFFYGNVLA
jgi:hypothetical protein